MLEITLVASLKRRFSKDKRSTLEGIEFRTLNLYEFEFLSSSFSLEVVEEVVWSCEGNKSLESDRFDYTFINSCWDMLKEETYGLVTQFHSNGKLPRAFTSSLVALIGKIKNPRLRNPKA